MPNSAMLKVSWARASVRPSASFTAGITGKNRWTASGVMNAVSASEMVKARPGLRRVDSIVNLCEPRQQPERVAPVDVNALRRRDRRERLVGLHRRLGDAHIGERPVGAEHDLIRRRNVLQATP